MQLGQTGSGIRYTIFMGSGARFSKVPKCLRARKVITKITNLKQLQSCSFHIFLTRTKFPCIKSFMSIHLFVFKYFKYRQLQNRFAGPKSFRGFREKGAREQNEDKKFGYKYVISDEKNTSFTSL